jgi:hypothetical protein
MKTSVGGCVRTEKLDWREIRNYFELLMVFLAHAVPRISSAVRCRLCSLSFSTVFRGAFLQERLRCFRGNLSILFTFQELECLCFFLKEQPSFRILSRCKDVKARHYMADKYLL